MTLRGPGRINLTWGSWVALGIILCIMLSTLAAALLALWLYADLLL